MFLIGAVMQNSRFTSNYRIIAMSMKRGMIRALLLCWFALYAAPSWAESLKLLVILSDGSTPYLSFADTLKANLPGWVQVTLLSDPQQPGLNDTHADLVVSVGMKATGLAVEKTNAPILAAMISEKGYAELQTRAIQQKIDRPMSAVYLDQPWERQIDFVRAALPDRPKIGLLHTPAAQIDIARLNQKVVKRGGSLVAQTVVGVGELFAGLEYVLEHSDGLLAIPDSLIYSSGNIRHILLTSYRHGIPLIGLSQAYVNAGALCAIFSTPEQLAAQTSLMVLSFARAVQLPEPQYPVDFTIAVNPQVARSMKIELPAPEAIRELMGKAKRGLN